MSYQAEVFNVMIAAPGDVKKELSIIKDAVHTWNAANSELRKIVLLPTHWQSNAAPETGQHPQDSLNRQLLDKCDLLVGVFWARIGTPTAEYASGTVEEIEKHVKAEKPAMIYFSDCAKPPSEVVPEQKAAVDAFKRQCEGRGLYRTYNTHAEFEKNFLNDLQLTVNSHPLFLEARVGSAGGSDPAALQLSEDARVLLNEGRNGGGWIYCHKHLAGITIGANGKKFNQPQDLREVARWEAAIEELENRGLLKAQSDNRETFVFTNEGFQVADKIAATQ